MSHSDETMLKGELLRNALLTLDPADVEVVTHNEQQAPAE